jgi:hypothetical protein
MPTFEPAAQEEGKPQGFPNASLNGENRLQENSMEEYTVKVRTATMSCFEGEKVPGGTEITRDQFKEARSSRIRLFGTIQVDDKPMEVQLVVAPKRDGIPEFRKLTDIITREGEMVCKGEIITSEQIFEDLVEYDPPLIRMELTNEKGEAAFRYTPKPAPKWAAEYGEWQVTPVDRGKDAAQTEAYVAKTRASRKERAKAQI